MAKKPHALVYLSPMPRSSHFKCIRLPNKILMEHSPTSTARTACILHIDAVESMPCMQCYRYGTIPTPRTNLHVDGVARIHDLHKLVWQGQLKPISQRQAPLVVHESHLIPVVIVL